MKMRAAAALFLLGFLTLPARPCRAGRLEDLQAAAAARKASLQRSEAALAGAKPGSLQALEAELAVKTAKREWYEAHLALADHTAGFAELTGGKDSDDAKALRAQVGDWQAQLDRAREAELASAAKLTQARQQSPPSTPKESAAVREEPVISESPRGSAKDLPAAEKEKSARVADDHLKTSSLSGSGTSLTGMAKSAQNLADRLGQDGLKGGAEDFAGKPLKEGTAPPAGMHTSRPDSMRPIDPSRPSTQQELALASVSGFKDSFARQGLRVLRRADGSVAVVDRSGRPATPDQLESLRRDIASQPAALMRYPDFFSAIAPEKYQGLKERYRQGEEARGKEFKDVGTTEAERDFKWDKSCDKVSGECNPNAEAGSYKKDDFVPPKDLDSIWDEVEKEEKRQEDIAAQRAKAELGRGVLASVAKKGLLDRVKGAVSGLLGSDDAGDDADGDPTDLSSADASPETLSADGKPAEGRVADRPGAPTREMRRSRRLARRAARWRKRALYGGAALTGGLLLCLGLRRRRTLQEYFRDRSAPPPEAP